MQTYRAEPLLTVELEIVKRNCTQYRHSFAESNREFSHTTIQTLTYICNAAPCIYLHNNVS